MWDLTIHPLGCPVSQSRFDRDPQHPHQHTHPVSDCDTICNRPSPPLSNIVRFGPIQTRLLRKVSNQSKNTFKSKFIRLQLWFSPLPFWDEPFPSKVKTPLLSDQPMPEQSSWVLQISQCHKQYVANKKMRILPSFFWASWPWRSSSCIHYYHTPTQKPNPHRIHILYTQNNT